MLRIDGSFPGGNVVVDRISGSDVHLHQDLRTTTTDWFYFCFRVRGGGGRRITFHFTGKSWMGPAHPEAIANIVGVRGPAVSLDGGVTWRWLGRRWAKPRLSWTIPRGAREVRFSFGMPYVESDLRRFLGRFRRHPALRAGTLCRSRRGRKVERLRFGCLSGRPAMKLLITCRHHACEMMASYALEGFIEAVLAPAGEWWRRSVEVLAIPFMDKDGVEDGDQGKNRFPHDHNRDYARRLFPEVRALTGLLPRWSAGRLKVALDLHCPHIRGPYNEVAYLVGSRERRIWREQLQFGRLLERARKGPVIYRARDNLPFGRSWNRPGEYSPARTCSQHVSRLRGVILATTLELPYANAAGSEVNMRSARLFGHDLAAAARAYLPSLSPGARGLG